MNAITITPLNRSHCEEYIALEFDTDVKKYVGGLPKKSQEEMRAQIAYGDNEGIYAILENSTGNFVGRCGYLEKGDEKEIYILIAKEHWGKKFAQSAICELLKIIGRHNIVGIVDPHNTRSLNLLQSLGFREAGRVKSADWQNNHIKFRLKENS